MTSKHETNSNPMDTDFFAALSNIGQVTGNKQTHKSSNDETTDLSGGANIK